MKYQRTICYAAASIVVATAFTASRPVSAATPTSETLLYAVYSGENTATGVFKTMQSAQKSTGERIEAYAVVSKDLKGKVRVRDQRKTDAGIGAIVGGVIGLLGGPPAVALGATAGGAAGYLTGDAVGIPRERVDQIKSSLKPDTSAVIVVLDNQWVDNVRHDLDQAHARAVIANQIAPKPATN